MARNGKVRNQAPKVDKQERLKKLVVGRAKKRLQYKRRIVNVNPGDKRKKGPNAGSGKKAE
jgi:small subunit ribosomal protein S30e